MNPIFVRTRKTYDSYQDFWKMVELAQFQTCFVDQVNLEEPHLYIFPTVNAEVPAQLKWEKWALGSINRKAILVWWHLERPDASKERLSEIGAGVYTNLEDALPLFDLIWSSDRWWVQQQGMPRKIVFVPMGSNQLLAGDRWRFDGQFKYDYCHFSYVAGRRGPIHASFHTLKAAPNGWGLDRERTLLASKVLVNIHQTPIAMGEPLRFAVAAAYGIPMISEECNDPWPLEPGVDFVAAPYNMMNIAVNNELRIGGFTHQTSQFLAQLGHSMHFRLCIEHPFQTEVIFAVETTRQMILPGGTRV